MSPLFWLDVVAYSISTLLVTALALMLLAFVARCIGRCSRLTDLAIVMGLLVMGAFSFALFCHCLFFNPRLGSGGMVIEDVSVLGIAASGISIMCVVWSLILLFLTLPRIKCRSQRIQQVFLNLISNARHARYPDGDLDKRLTIRIAEVEKDGRPRVFTPFFTTKRPDEGAELGFSASYGIVQDHHGDIRVELPVDSGWEM